MIRLLQLVAALACITFCLPMTYSKAPAGPWDEFNLSPPSRTVRPVTIHSTHGTIQNVHNLITENGIATFPANKDTWTTLDFGKEVGGWISLTINLPTTHLSSTTLPLSLSFTESPLFISPSTSDDSPTPAFNQSYDGVEHIVLPSGDLKPGGSIHWTQPIPRLRGGFRYLTIISNSSSSPFVSPNSDILGHGSMSIGVSNVTCEISFMPHIPGEDLRSYAGYFYASDPVFHDKDFLTKIWYAGAYTVQTNIADGDQVRQVPVVPSPGWDNAGTIGISGPVLLDGAKRDREVWPGDMGISLATSFLTLLPSTSDDGDELPFSSSSPIRNSLAAVFARQNPETGELPWSAQPVSPTGSDTYHMWTIIGVHDYFLWSGDAAFVEHIWGNYTKAMQYVQNKITPSGLMNVTGVRDWGRLVQGGINSEANAILYRALKTASQLSSLLHLDAFPSQSATYTSLANNLKTAFQSTFWDPARGLFRDNDTTTDTIHPQDANSLAVLFGLTDSMEQANQISQGLKANWGEIGAVAPELTGTIIPFIGGFEIQAHFAAGNDDLAMELLRLEWGFILYTNISVQSTLLEGYNFDGTLSYRATSGNLNDSSFTSHAHGWSTGPTPALTSYVLGLNLQLPSDQAPAIPYQPGQFWSVNPHLAGLESAEGGFETTLGWFGVKWNLSDGGNMLTLSVEAPLGTSGTITLPRLPSSSSGSDLQEESVRMDGLAANVTRDDSGNLELKVAGGNHTIVLS